MGTSTKAQNMLRFLQAEGPGIGLRDYKSRRATAKLQLFVSYQCS
jgi:hypothetical protein